VPRSSPWTGSLPQLLGRHLERLTRQLQHDAAVDHESGGRIGFSEGVGDERIRVAVSQTVLGLQPLHE
jgi:hypothetical protein